MLTIRLGIGGVLGIVFIVLKLTEVIDWSWVWVLCPIWLPLAFALGVLLFGLTVMVLAAILK